MPKTVQSTTTITSPTDEVSYGYSPCPIRPSSVVLQDESNGLSWANGIKQSNGDYIYWNECEVRKSCADGTRITWFNKPTLADVTKNINGTYYRFHNDGSVEAKYNGYDKIFVWSPEIDGVAEEGELIWTHFNQDKEEYEENEEPVPCRVCKSDCRGYDYEGSSICCRDCLNDCVN